MPSDFRRLHTRSIVDSRRLTILVLFAWLAVSGPLHGQVQAAPSPEPDTTNSELRRRAAHNVPIATVGAATAIIAFTALFDPAIARSASKSQSDNLTRFADHADRLGEVSVIAPVLVGTTIIGLVTGTPELLRLAVRTAGAITVVSVGVQLLKFATGRDRPYQDEDFGADDFHPFTRWDTSFPSGHTAAAFAMATTLGDAIGNKYATAGLYVLAAGTGWARVVLLKHWPSDVVAGAAIGLLAGNLATGRIKVFGIRAPRAIVTPDELVVGYTLPMPRLR